MGKIAVVYKSVYGFSKQYAKWVGAALDADLFELNAKTADKLGEYPVIIYGAGVYAGTIEGFAIFRRIFKKYKDKNYILFVTGLSPAENTGAFKQIIDKAFTPEMHAKVKPFYLRGGIDYLSLKLFHKTIMSMLNAILSKKKTSALSDAEKSIVSTYGKTVSYLDESAIEPILAHVCSLRASD